MRFFTVAGLCLAAVLSLSVSAAADNVAPADANVDSIETFLSKQNALRSQLDNGQYPAVTKKSKAQIFAAQDIIFAKLDGKSSLNQLNDDDFLLVVNQQELIVSILSNTEDDRMICRREHKVGSFFDRNVCISKKERERMQRETDAELRYLNKLNRAVSGS